jgi:hypothetical protein
MASWWRGAAMAMSGPAASAEILIFGDSLLQSGVIPEVVRDELGMTAYNAAVQAGPPAASVVLLDRAIRAGARPKAIIVDAQPFILAEVRPARMIGEWASMAGVADALAVATEEGDVEFFGAFVVARLLPSLRARKDIRDALAAAYGGTATPEAEFVASRDLVDRQAIANRGGFVLPGKPETGAADPFAGGAASDWEAQIIYPAAWTPRPPNVSALRRFLTRTASLGAPVFFVVPPMHPDVQAKRERLGLDAAYIAFVRRIRDEFPHVVVVDARHAGFPARALADWTHLNRDGAASFSRSLARVVGDRFAHPVDDARWVAAPSYSAEPSRVAIEDYFESHKAILRDRASRQ